MGKIIAVHSFRGGTGKSNITANLAVSLAAQGNRVGIVDTDIQSPGIHVLFGLAEETISRTMNNYLWGEAGIKDVAYDTSGILQVAPGGREALFLLPASIRTADISRITRDGYDVTRLTEGVYDAIDALSLDYLLLDSHPGIDEVTLLTIAIADVLVLILRPDQQDFQGTAVTVELARRLDIPRLVLVVNKVLPELDPQEMARQVGATYQAEVAGVLPLSEEVVRLASGGIFSLQFPDHLWSRGVRSIAGAIAS
jgi:MinD-like ATPase involved in chromosome partitioning or flagellar assembly